MTERLLLGPVAPRRLQRGLDAVATAVRITLGPAGRGAVVAGATGPVLTHEGATIADAVELADPHANMGASLAREAAATTRRGAGDGGTTTVLLARAIAAHGARALHAGACPHALVRGIEAAVARVTAHVERAARPVEGEREIRELACAAAQDQHLGRLVADACARTGPQGAVSVEEAHTPASHLDVTPGLRLNEGYLSPFMVTHPERMEAVLEEPYVLLHQARIATWAQLAPVLDHVAPTGRPLLVIAGDLASEPLSALVTNRLRGTLLAAAVRAPALGDSRLARLADVGALTGAEVVVPEKGRPLEHAGPGVLGRAARAVVTRDATTVTADAGSHAAVAARVSHIRHELTKAGDELHRRILTERLAMLSGGLCVVRVGAPTETERAARARRAAHAVAATRAALDGGAVAGGGAALAQAARALEDGSGPGSGERADTGDERAGMAAVRAALAEPARWIAHNAGAAGSPVAARVGELPAGHGWNAATQRFGDLCAQGVLDPVRVPCTALRSAASVAALVLTCGALVADPAPRDPEAVSWRRRPHGHAHAHETGPAVTPK